jgi:gas vesicle protein
MTEHDNSRHFFIGLALGAAVGMAVAILYAPHSGKETRAILHEKAIKAKETAKEIIEEAEEKAKTIIAEARGRATEIKEAEKK